MNTKILALTGVFLAAIAASGGAVARTHVGVAIGVPFGAPVYYPPPYYYYPPAVVVAPAPAAPPVYVEQGQAPTQQGSDGYWYYCRRPAGYYPYVRQCNENWERVPARPPEQP